MATNTDFEDNDKRQRAAKKINNNQQSYNGFILNALLFPSHFSYLCLHCQPFRMTIVLFLVDCRLSSSSPSVNTVRRHCFDIHCCCCHCHHRCRSLSLSLCVFLLDRRHHHPAYCHVVLLLVLSCDRHSPSSSRI